MRKFIKAAGVCAISAFAASAFSMAGCGHTHKWEWRRTETEHWQVCTVNGCDKERNRGTHENSLCSDCAEFKALAFGFADCIGVQGIDDAHADFAQEANEWFSQKGKELGFIYDSVDTYKSGWDALNEDNLKNYDLIVLLNNKPGTESSQAAFRNYMENGGACVAFHASGFAMWEDPDKAPSEFEDWYSNTLLRCGVYGECNRRDPSDRGFTQYWNTWNPTSEPMKIETYDHFVTENLVSLDLESDTFISAPCEWYEWHKDLFEDEENTTVLVSMNPTPENPAGDDPRKGAAYEHQIWEGGHHAIAWANKNYNMVYMNWGHNLRPYNDGAEGKSSKTFSSEVQNQITLDAMFGLVKNGRTTVK